MSTTTSTTFATKLCKITEETGVYFQDFNKYASRVKLNRTGDIATVTMKIGLNDLTDDPDARSLLMPHALTNTKLIPMIVFIDPEKFLNE